MILTTEQIVAGFALITEQRLTIAALQQRLVELEAKLAPAPTPHADACAVFTPAARNRDSPIPCTCGAEG